MRFLKCKKGLWIKEWIWIVCWNTNGSEHTIETCFFFVLFGSSQIPNVKRGFSSASCQFKFTLPTPHFAADIRGEANGLSRRRNHQGVIWIFPMASLSFALRFRKVPRLVSSHRFIGREGFLPQPQGLALAEGRRWGGTHKTLHFWYLKNFCEVAWPPTQPLQATRGEFDDPWLGFGLDGYFRWALFNRLAIVEWVMGPPIQWPNINGLSLRFFHTYFCGVYDPEKTCGIQKKRRGN